MSQVWYAKRKSHNYFIAIDLLRVDPSSKRRIKPNNPIIKWEMQLLSCGLLQIEFYQCYVNADDFPGQMTEMSQRKKLKLHATNYSISANVTCITKMKNFQPSRQTRNVSWICVLKHKKNMSAVSCNYSPYVKQARNLSANFNRKSISRNTTHRQPLNLFFLADFCHKIKNLKILAARPWYYTNLSQPVVINTFPTPGLTWLKSHLHR